MNFGLHRVVSAEIAGELGKKQLSRAKELLLSYSKLNLLMGLILSFSLFLPSSYLASLFSKPDIAPLLQIASLMVFLEALRYIFNISFQSSSHFKYLSIMSSLEASARLVFVFSLFSLGSLNLITALLSYPFSIAVSLFLSFPLLMRSLKKYHAISPTKLSLFRRMVSTYGKYAIIRQPFGSVVDNAPVWVIKFILGVEAVGLYSLARRMYAFIRTFITSIERVLIPTLSYEITQNRERVRNMLFRGVKYGFYLSSTAVILAILFMPSLLALLHLEKYYPAIPVFNIIILNLIVVGVGYLFRPVLFALKAQKEITLLYVLSALFFLPIATILAILLRSPTGVALAVVLNGSIITLMRYIFIVRKDQSLRLPSYLFLKIDRYDIRMLKRIFRGFKRRI